MGPGGYCESAGDPKVCYSLELTFDMPKKQYKNTTGIVISFTGLAPEEFLGADGAGTVVQQESDSVSFSEFPHDLLSTNHIIIFFQNTPSSLNQMFIVQVNPMKSDSLLSSVIGSTSQRLEQEFLFNMSIQYITDYFKESQGNK